MKLKKRIRSIFARPEQRLIAIMTGLLEIRSEFEGFSYKNPLEEIVTFFNLISPWHDRGDVEKVISAFEDANYGQHEQVLEKLRILQTHIVRAGRDPYGMNRTEKGQIVTEDDVWLGNIWGLFTKKVSFWKEGKDASPYLGDKNAHNIVSHQAEKFMTSHIDPMTEVIDWLEVYLRRN